MGFKDTVKEDILSTFFNFEEFGERHVISGKEIVCIFDEDKFQAKQRNGLITTDDGVYKRGYTIYIPSVSFKYRPHAEEKLYVDGQKYTVIECKEDIGVLEIDVIRCDET